MRDTDEDCELPIELRLAAIVTLLSASALRGPTAAKTLALRTHLAAATRTPGLDPALLDALGQALAGWQAIACHPGSVSVPLCPLTAPGQSLH
jgi:hypothetical protein